jgi:type IV pilus assembly protein PilQ
MGDRHTSTNHSIRWTLTAAALACLAGTATSLAQSGAAPAAPAAAPVAAPSAPAAPSGTAGKAMSQAGSQPKDGGQADDPKVKVDEHLIVDLHVNDEQLANVLQMLSIQSQKNIIASKNVAATITANLYGVSFYEALDAILHVNGYGYVEKGNFIYVYTLEELETLNAQLRVAVWKVVKLNYLNATDAAEFVKPLLSEKGQIKTNGKAPAFNDTMTSGGEDFAHESTLLVFDFEENLGEIERVLAQMDTRPAQVLVEATILQTALNEANAFGVDFSVLGDLSFGDFLSVGGPLKAVDVLINGGDGEGGEGGPAAGDEGGAVVSNPGNTGGPATFKAGIVQNDVAAFLRLLDEVSDTQIISRPNILALNRVPARVLVGRKVGYLNTTSTDTATTQTVEFLETGTQLSLRPFISADGMIRMQLKPKVSEAVIRNVTNTGGAAVTIPDEISNEITTEVMVRDGQTIVLGGLFKESTQATRRQVPFAGDIPIIGAAFRGHDDETQRSEIIFMITPTIMADTILLEQGQRGMAMVERVRAGSREGLLPWSREKRTQQMVVQATELARQGKREEALYKVQRALRLNKNQPDAIALREDLLGKRSDWPSRSLQDEIVHGELQRAIEQSGEAAKPQGNSTKPTQSSARSLAAAQASTPAPSSTETVTPAVTPTAPAEQADAEPSEPMSAAPSSSPSNVGVNAALSSAFGQSSTASKATTTEPNGEASTPSEPAAPPEWAVVDSPESTPSTPSGTETPGETTTETVVEGVESPAGETVTEPAVSETTEAATSTETSSTSTTSSRPRGFGALASFRNVWSLLHMYSQHRTNPDDTSTVTTVPTESADSK